MKLNSYGAALEVTGSQHLLTVNGKNILLDCGLFQGHRQEAFQKNRDFLYEPGKVDIMILSHAHIDHSGKIPYFVKQGFKGVIYCTEATRDLCEVMLLDSANIQASDAEYFGRKLSETAVHPIEPLYDEEDVEEALKHFKTCPYDKAIKIAEGVEVFFREAGHVLGSALLEFRINDQEDGKKKVFVFSGDIGRTKLPILRDPYQVEKADVLLIESTYGNRTHAPIEEGIPELARVINRTIKRGGKIIIPSFAFERTQELIFGLHTLADDGVIPKNLPIFIDSPLASNITGIFQQHDELYDEELHKIFKGKNNPFQMHQLKYVGTIEESKGLNSFVGPCIIISASGMCEAGRIRHHLSNHIEDPKNSIVIVGFMAEHTLGRKLVDGDPMVKIFDQMFKVNAEVVVLESFSAHADMNDLDSYIKNTKGLKKVLLVHGEQDQSTAMAERIKTTMGIETEVVKPATEIVL